MVVVEKMRFSDVVELNSKLPFPALDYRTKLDYFFISAWRRNQYNA